jgi:hypothetical protein
MKLPGADGQKRSHGHEMARTAAVYVVYPAFTLVVLVMVGAIVYVIYQDIARDNARRRMGAVCESSVGLGIDEVVNGIGLPAERISQPQAGEYCSAARVCTGAWACKDVYVFYELGWRAFLCVDADPSHRVVVKDCRVVGDDW